MTDVVDKVGPALVQLESFAAAAGGEGGGERGVLTAIGAGILLPLRRARDSGEGSGGGGAEDKGDGPAGGAKEYIDWAPPVPAKEGTILARQGISAGSVRPSYLEAASADFEEGARVEASRRAIVVTNAALVRAAAPEAAPAAAPGAGEHGAALGGLRVRLRDRRVLGVELVGCDLALNLAFWRPVDEWQATPTGNFDLAGDLAAVAPSSLPCAGLGSANALIAGQRLVAVTHAAGATAAGAAAAAGENAGGDSGVVESFGEFDLGLRSDPEVSASQGVASAVLSPAGAAEASFPGLSSAPPRCPLDRTALLVATDAAPPWQFGAPPGPGPPGPAGPAGASGDEGALAALCNQWGQVVGLWAPRDSRSTVSGLGMAVAIERVEEAAEFLLSGKPSAV